MKFERLKFWCSGKYKNGLTGIIKQAVKYEFTLLSKVVYILWDFQCVKGQKSNSYPGNIFPL